MLRRADPGFTLIRLQAFEIALQRRLKQNRAGAAPSAHRAGTSNQHPSKLAVCLPCSRAAGVCQHTRAQGSGPLDVTVTVRRRPLLPARSGTRVARRAERGRLQVNPAARPRSERRNDRATGRSQDEQVVMNEWLSLDRVMQAPGAADEDTTGGFDHGGWQLRSFDDLSQKWVVENLTAAAGAGVTSRCAAKAAKSRMSVGPTEPTALRQPPDPQAGAQRQDVRLSAVCAVQVTGRARLDRQTTVWRWLVD
jgi:hypothetical protein